MSPAGGPGRCFLIDGYNVIHSIPELRTEKGRSIEAATRALADAAADMAALEEGTAQLVLDGSGEGSAISERPRGRLEIIYTAAGESADGRIGELARAAAGRHQVTVVSSDAAVQTAALAAGALRMTPREFWQRVRPAGELRQDEEDAPPLTIRDDLRSRLDEETRRRMDGLAGRDV